jgi:predicted Zn-dependent peptidase
MAIEVLADMVAASVIDAAEFEVERQVILEELAMADDDPSDVAHERITETVLRDHPLGRPIGGNPDTIRASTRDSVLEHYARYYRPHELVVTAAGAVDHRDLVNRVTQALSDAGWDLGVSSAPASRRGVTQAEIDRAPRSLVITRPLEQAVVALATRGLRATDERRPALSVLSSVLGGGMSSRLFQEIRERRGLAYSVYSFASAYADAGMFGMAAGTSPAHVAEVAGLMTTELSSIAQDGITAEELSRTRGNIAGASALALESSDARMMRLGRSELSTGEFVDRDEGLLRLSRVDLSDVQVLAQELLSTPLSAVVVGAVKDGIVDGVIDQDTIRSS